MLFSTLVLILACASPTAAPPEDGPGRIGGFVVNATQGGHPAAAADVYLQARIDGEFVVVGRARTDHAGRFLFEGLPVDQGIVYLPGASRDGIHYPGPRVDLTGAQPEAHVVVTLHEVATGPRPLVIREQDVVIAPEPNALRVTETLVIENPTPTTYVGPAPEGENPPVTFELRIPPDFERVTFDKEFFGRQFTLAGDRLVTSIPWPPGRREVRLTYVLPRSGKTRTWQRRLDLPCDHLRITTRESAANSATCSLGAPERQRDGSLRFDSGSRPAPVPAGLVVTVEMRDLPVSIMNYARWVVLGALIALIGGRWWSIRRRNRLSERVPTRRERRKRRPATAASA